MNKANLKKYLPHIAVALTLLYFGSNMRPHSSAAGDFNYRDFGKLEVIDGGRHKPMDSVARNSLMIITHRQTYTDLDAPTTVFGIIPSYKQYPATKWLLDVLTTPPPNGDDDLEDLFQVSVTKRPAWGHKVFRIDSDELAKFLDLERRESRRYSYEEIASSRKFPDFLRALRDARNLEPKQLTAFDAKVIELSQHMQLFLRLSAHAAPLLIPETNGGDQWKSFHDALDMADARKMKLPEELDTNTFVVYRELLVHYDRGEKREFNALLAKHLAELQSQGKLTKVNVELFFNEFAPFYHCLVIYVLLFVAGLGSFVCLALGSDWTRPIQRAAFWSMAATFVVHLSGLVMRMYLQDRMFVFVTNLYSSAVFIGLGAVAIALIAEALFNKYLYGIGIVAGSATGFCTLIIAHMLSMSGDTMEMMQAVLDTNFWLATHVTCITLGYTTTFVAGAMGIAYIGLGIFTNLLRGDVGPNLSKAIYGVLCGGMFLSFVGTVLGGLWADYSWGRFWGWDPKENGALLIVIWIALILHARWGGMVKQRGVAVLSVVGIIVTSWSWFGTNFLGVGLHSYGFRQGAMATLVLIDFGFLAIAGLGCLPLEHWKSFQTPTPDAGSGLGAKANAVGV